ncbi:biotin carboxylase [Actinomadura pelletieri DSM 43383]|uniref:Biotin carboxylase n=1 Tax=Actinomadura pelletieri DSM 43383 TaxID=1120940 RepID=A0A495Q9V4_9ACTN|nr:ATP-grasp domain-containing protein [Actinomadura pelletieri]RKS68237.1 biotin carboxylase [Actinomadura pelletieri DSM 43383]
MKAAGPTAVLLVDPVITGLPFKRVCRARGHAVVSLYTISPSVLAEIAPDHAEGNDVTLYAADPDEAYALVTAVPMEIRAVVPATEPAVHVADVLAAKLGLPGNDPATASARRNKTAMRRLAVSGGVPVPDFLVVTDLSEVPDAATEIGYPLILKPATGASARDVRLVPTVGDLPDAIAASASRDLFGAPIQEWLVERYVRGREFAVNAFSLNGRHEVIDIWEYRQPWDADYDQPYWDLIQLPHADPAWGPAADLAVRVLEVFGMRNGPSHTEVKGNASGLFMMEIGGRLPGAKMADHWERHASFQPFEATLDAYLGMPRDRLDPRFDAVLGICCLRNDGPAGRLHAVHGLDGLRELRGVDEIQLRYVPGERVPRTCDLDTVVAKVLVSGPDHASVTDLMTTVRQKVEMEIE